MVRKIMAIAGLAAVTVAASPAPAEAYGICASVVVYANGGRYPAGTCLLETSIPMREFTGRFGAEPALYADVRVNHP